MADKAADLVLTGGRVWIGDAARRSVEAIAIRGDRVVAIGADRDVRPLVDPTTRVVELRGRMVTPGFQDAHIHTVSSGLVLSRCDLHDETGLDRYLEVIRAYAAAHPGREWITGGGWSLDDFPDGCPRREDLDRLVPGRPVYLTNRDGHDAWVSTRALELAGIGVESPDPPDGRIERAPDGTPTGTLHEGAMELVERLIPPDTQEDYEQAVRVAQGYLHGLGLTAWQEAWVERRAQAAYLALAGRGEVTARVVLALWWRREAGLEQIDELVERRASGSVGTVRSTTVKLMQDGIVENFTAAMIDPYLAADGRPTTNRGLSFIDPAVLAETVTRLDALGFQAHFHAIGDRAVRECLDAVENARRANGWTDTRPHISHIQVIHPDDLLRFARLGVVANAQPYWAVSEGQMERLTVPFLGPERSTWQYPFRSLRRAGAVLAMGSDWSVSTPNPLLEMEVAVTRVAPGSRGTRAPFLPEERIELVDALAAFTSGSAHVNHLDDTGTLERGRLADLVVLDRDLFAPDAGPIGDASVVATVVGGRTVFEDGLE